MRRLSLLWSLCFLLCARFATAQAAPRHASPILSLAFSPDGSRIAAGLQGEVVILEAKTGKTLLRLTGHAGAVTALAFRPDGVALAAAGGVPGKSGEIRLWEMPSGKPLRTLKGHSDAIYSVAFRPDGKRLAAGSYDRFVSVWNVEGGAPKMLKDHTDAVYGVAYRSDGKRIASVAGDRTLKVWDADSGKRLFTLNESTAELYSVAFRPDGLQVAAGGADKTLRTWNLTAASGALAKAAFAHQGAILKVAYAPKGKDLLSAGEDAAVKRWDAISLAEKRVYPKQPDWPQALAVSPNGTILAIGRHNGSLALYELTTGRLLQETLKPASSVLLHARAPRFCLTQQSSELKIKPTGGPTLFVSSLSSMNPVGMQRGKTVRVSLYGADIKRATGIYFDDPSLSAKRVTPPDPNVNALHIDVTSDPKTRLGLHRVMLTTERGATNGLTFAVGDWQETKQTEPNNAPDTAQKIALPATLIGAIDTPGDTDLYRFSAQAGEEIVFEVIAQPLRSRLQPVLTLLDSEGKTVAQSAFRPGRADVVLGRRFEKSGDYFVRVSDFQNQFGNDVFYRLNIGRFPFLLRTFPLGVRKGETREVALEGYNLGAQAKQKVTVPADAQAQTFALTELDGKPAEILGENALAVGEDPEISASSSNHSPETAQKVPFPVAINGALWTERPQGAGGSPAQYFRFPAKKGVKTVLEVLARRRGSPLDSMIEILDSKGKPVERVTLRAVGQTEITLNDRDSLSGGLRLINWDDFHVNDYLMAGREVIRILALPKGPDDDVAFRTYRGRRLGYFGTTPEFHSLGSMVYKVEAHPPGSRFSPNGYPLVHLNYQNDDGNALYDKDSYLEFEPPADGEYFVRLTDARGMQGKDFVYRLMIRPARPDFRLLASGLHSNVPKGGGAIISVECERYDGFEGEIALEFQSPAAGFSATRTVIEAGETSAMILVSETSAAAVVSRAYCQPPVGSIVGRAKIGGKEVLRRIERDIVPPLFSLMPETDLEAQTDRRTVTIRPGAETTVEVRIRRKGNFGRRVPIDVRNLPFGVRVQNIGLNGVLVTEEETARKFTLYCEPWVKPQTRPFYVTGVVEGGVNHTAPPLLLTVEPALPMRK